MIRREAVWTLDSIDPETGFPPLDPFVGFLPPNDPSGRGEGFARLTMRPPPTVPDGTNLAVYATIQMDQNVSLQTTSVANQIDAIVPASAVLDDFTLVDSTGIIVRWSASDGAPGSGIHGLALYMGRDLDPYHLAGIDLAGNETFVPAEPGHTYRFFTQARDNSGNIEPPKTEPDATIRFVPPWAVFGTSTEVVVVPTVTVGDTVASTFTISNSGATPLLVSGITPPTPEMVVSPVPPLNVPAAQSVQVTLSAKQVAQLRIASNDRISSNRSIPMILTVRELTFDTQVLTTRDTLPLRQAVTIQVIPDDGVHVERGSLFFRPAGAVSFSRLDLVRQGRAFIAVIPGEAAIEGGIEYYVVVENSAVEARTRPLRPSFTASRCNRLRRSD